MEEKELKALSVIFGATGCVLTVWGLPALYQFLQVFLSPKITPKDLASPNHKYTNRYITLTGRISSTSSFPRKTDASENVIFSRLKTKLHTLSNQNYFSKEVQSCEFYLAGDPEIRICPAYHSIIKGENVHSSYKASVSLIESILYNILQIFLLPITFAFNLPIKLGETIKEDTLSVYSTVAVSGRLTLEDGMNSMVPEFVAPEVGKIRWKVFSNCAKYWLFQGIMIGLSAFCYYMAVQRAETLVKPKSVCQGNKGFKCLKCEAVCGVLYEPCMHICVCKNCADGENECLVCRKRIINKVSMNLS